MNERLRFIIQITTHTCILGLAISYATQIIPNLPKLNFLEAIGVYCLWTPIHNILVRRDDE